MSPFSKIYFWILFYSWVTLLGCISCNNRSEYDCDQDDAAIAIFRSKMSTIDREYHRTGNLSSQLVRSIFFLEEVTSIKSSIEWGDVSYYPSEESVESDLSKWDNWFLVNNCLLRSDSLIFLDSLIIEETNWMLD